MSFSWANMKKRAIDKKVLRNKTMAIAGSNKDFKDANPTWVQKAQSKDFTDLVSKTKQTTERRQAEAIARRNKLAGK